MTIVLHIHETKQGSPLILWQHQVATTIKLQNETLTQTSGPPSVKIGRGKCLGQTDQMGNTYTLSILLLGCVGCIRLPPSCIIYALRGRGERICRLA